MYTNIDPLVNKITFELVLKRLSFSEKWKIEFQLPDEMNLDGSIPLRVLPSQPGKAEHSQANAHLIENEIKIVILDLKS